MSYNVCMLADAKQTVFSSKRLKWIADAEQVHFWFQGRQALVHSLISTHVRTPGARVLDLGCGTGSHARRLHRQGFEVVGLDRRPEGLREGRKQAPEIGWVRADATALPFRSGSFDAVLMLDLLEHVPEEPTLAELQRVLRPGGVIIGTVPAMQWLWSYRDDAAGHLRRYSRRRLRTACLTAGLDLAETRFYQCLLFPLVAASRLLGRKHAQTRDLEDHPHPLLNRCLGWITSLEVVAGRRVRWPIGSTLAFVCRRGDAA